MRIPGARWALVLTIFLLAACGQAVSPPSNPATSAAAAGGAAGSAKPAAASAAAPAPSAAAPASTAAKDQVKVKLAVPTKSLLFLPFYLGQDKGMFAGQGVDLDLQVLAANNAIAAVLNGDIDFTAAGGSAMRAAVQGSPVKAILISIGKPTLFIYGKPSIQSVSQLKGKNIAVTSVAGSVAGMTKEILTANGIDPEKDVKLVGTQTTETDWTALKGGSVDAAVLDPPYDALAANGGFRLIASASEFVKGTQAQLATSTKLLQGNPDKVKRMLRGTLASIGYTLDHEQGSIDFIAKTWSMSPEDAKVTYHTISQGLLRNGMAAPEALKGEIGANATQADLDKVTDFSLLRQVDAEMGLK